MKGPNPFVPWDETVIMGRKQQMEAFSVFLDRVAGGSSGVLLLYGIPGSGKSMLMKLFHAEAQKRGLFAPYMKVEKRDKLDRISKALFSELENEIAAKEPSRADVLSKEGNTGTLKGVIGALEKVMHSNFPGVVFLIDDLDRTRKSEEMIRNIANVAKEKRKVGFVVSSTKRFEPPENAETMHLDQVEEQEFHDYIAKMLKKEPKMGEECIKAIYADCGGNPKLLKQVCWILYDSIRENEKMITKAHYVANMRSMISFLSRDWFGKLYATASQQEKIILKNLARAPEPLSVKELAAGLNKGMGPVATLLIRLEGKGHIVRVERGRYKIFSKLYAKFIQERG